MSITEGDYCDSGEAGGVLARGPFQIRDVAALLVTGDGRYLMQLRDDVPNLRVAGHWGLFGGGVEPGETHKEALARELVEELEFQLRTAHWFTECAFVLPQIGVAATEKVFFVVPVDEADLTRMVQHEGAGRRLFTLDELLVQPRVVPWDLCAVLMHARRETVFRWPSTE